jgi:hypothetical protein
MIYIADIITTAQIPLKKFNLENKCFVCVRQLKTNVENIEHHQKKI